MGGGVSKDLELAQSQTQKTQEELEKLKIEKDKELKEHHTRELEMMKEGHQQVRDMEREMSAKHESKLSSLQNDVKILEKKIRDHQSETIKQSQTAKNQSDAMLTAHKNEILRLERDHKEAISRKDEEIKTLRQELIRIQQQGDTRLDNHLSKHSGVIKELREECQQKEKNIEKLQGDYVEVLREVSAGKEHHLKDIKEYQKRLDQTNGSEVQGKYIVHNTFIVDFPDDSRLNEHNGREILDAIQASANSTISAFGGKLIKQVDMNNGDVSN